VWTYTQQTGELQHNGQHEARGYSGNGQGKNNPEMEAIHYIGPIPRGLWTIGKVFEGHASGPHAISLYPFPETNTFGRQLFFIHGDRIGHAGDASKGCLVFDPFTRGRLAETPDKILQVI
jgi:hypothetical protein